MNTYHTPPRFEELISLDFYRYVYEEQQILDAEFLKVSNRPPSLQDRKNCLLDERGEFYNETKHESRYFTNKVNDPQRQLEEYSDILLFYIGIIIVQVEDTIKMLDGFELIQDKNEQDTRERYIREHYGFAKYAYEKYCDKYIVNPCVLQDKPILLDNVIDVLSKGREQYRPSNTFALATLTMALYGFTTFEIRSVYEKVKAENYKRIGLTRQGKPDR